MTRVVVNLREIRAKRAAEVPVIVDGEGVAHEISALSLDNYLALIGIMETMRDNRAAAVEGADAGTVDKMVVLIKEMVSVVQAVVPTFPVGTLGLDELLLVVDAIQESMPGAPATPTEGEAPSPENLT